MGTTESIYQIPPCPNIRDDSLHQDIDDLKKDNEAILKHQEASGNAIKASFQEQDSRYETTKADIMDKIDSLHKLVEDKFGLIEEMLKKEKKRTKYNKAILNNPQHVVLRHLKRYIRDGGNVNDDPFSDGVSLLHKAVGKRWLIIAETLLEAGIDTLKKDTYSRNPLEMALSLPDCDDMSALIVNYMDKEEVREISKNSFENYLKKEKTVYAMLDCTIDEKVETAAKPLSVSVYFEIPERYFEKIVLSNNKNIIDHPVIRFLVQRKWDDFAKQRFGMYALLYLVSLIAITFALMSGVVADDVKTYSSQLDYARAFFEILSCLIILGYMVKEIVQLVSTKKDYFKDLFNPCELLASGMFVIAASVRYANVTAHWYILSVAYFLWTIIIFKYAAVSIQAGTYAQILWYIFTGDVVQFSLLFAGINVVFTGTFLLVLKGDGSLDLNGETSGFWEVFYTGLRTMIEGQPIIEYTGDDGYRPFGTIVMLVFLFVTIVIMLNILIAQLSSTYARIQDEARVDQHVNLARIVHRIEKHDWMGWLLKKVNLKSTRSYTEMQNYSIDEIPTSGDLKNSIIKILKKRAKSVKQYSTFNIDMNDTLVGMYETPSTNKCVRRKYKTMFKLGEHA